MAVKLSDTASSGSVDHLFRFVDLYELVAVDGGRCCCSLAVALVGELAGRLAVRHARADASGGVAANMVRVQWVLEHHCIRLLYCRYLLLRVALSLQYFLSGPLIIVLNLPLLQLRLEV